MAPRRFVLLGSIIVACTTGATVVAAADTVPISSKIAAGAFANQIEMQPRLSRAYLHTRVPSPRVLSNPLCPAREIIHQVASCAAEFEYHGIWRLVIGTVTQQQVDNGSFNANGSPMGNPKDQGTIRFVRAWRRRWRSTPAKCLRSYGLPGRLSSNDGFCYAQLAQDTNTAGVVYVHGTDTAGFDPIYRYACRRYRGGKQCTNRVGDAFRYVP